MVKAINIGLRDEPPTEPGEYQFVYYDDKICGMDYVCPCGNCKDGSYLPFAGNDLETSGPSWEFDGNTESPTLNPSILRTSSCKWHGYLKSGVFVGC